MRVIRKDNVCGTWYTVALTSADEMCTASEGETDIHECRISILDELSRAARPRVYWHELGHAAFMESGLDAEVKSRFGLTSIQALAFEELIMNVFVPAYADTLVRNGHLKAPRLC